MNKKTDNLLELLVDKRRFSLRLLLEGLAVGLGAGISISVFRYLLAGSEILRPVIYHNLREALADGQWQWLALYILSFIIIAYLLKLIVAREPMCTGSGIPQIKGILQGDMSMRWFSVLWSKIIGGVLAIGAGMSLGREGPSVQIGACVGQGLSQTSRRTRFESRILMTAGAGAGLAAAFNAPLAGVIFGLEEMQKTISPALLLTGITASITAATVTEVVFGMSPVFSMGYLLPLPLNLFDVLVATGIVIGLLGRLFNIALAYSLNTYSRLGLSGMKKPLVPLALAGILGFVLPEILGGGNLLVDSLVVTDYTIGFLCLLFVGKFLFTMICFGSGVPGGIFLPMLVLGAAGGAVLAKLLVLAGLLPAMYYADIIVFGMAAYFSSVVKSPVTGSILILEMTGSFQHMLALLVVSLTAYVISDLTGGRPVYDELLDRALGKSK
ncbi:MAG: ClC family H(+)/Cl(-) exchange transporter [Veillonellaceae bacterium]|uniref:ClC family H(+)/Cl(-) exchange transporter n=1 Tax=Anaerovibrio lipolyticus TaxID=82374 RepID=UPI001F455FAA|nr:ClC family H(+)/Cl(-) exchange transporter [Anaerovibrio lipolyticus]MCF2600656.1 ClC family H(+)/Cl(-) exchange transporter [Anaerovibrio lipolyticus]MCI7235944.1 ClC family H(+)/Cl(-) exchange transporter [Veillonellaceae bacterium]MDD6563419.1 ClC family H(+)/Cl(-) exchange transporter [Veillonellaceae bacterium]MDY5053594.1 ClC family H(+)/Cl(-) exchange transporter [Anaerovibrio sp.]